MTDITHNDSSVTNDAIVVSTAKAAESRQEDVSKLLARLQEASPAASQTRPPDQSTQYENQLAIVRLGVATSLFYCLRTKHAATAARGLRVAFSCSAWAERLGVTSDERDRIEVAALLHDLGKVGIPDRILRKPSKLTLEERLSMDCCPQLACEILRGSTNDQELLDIVRFANTWYESREHEDAPTGSSLPLGSRMLLIAGAFDAMTTDNVYRSALSRERALQELVRGSGTQFDPELIIDFTQMLEDRPEMLQHAVVKRWLQELEPNSANAFWTGNTAKPTASKPRRTIRRETNFHERLLIDLKDGVVFTDAEGTITHWNAAMVQLTGISVDAAIGQTWNAESFNLRDTIVESDSICPLRECFATNASISRGMIVERAGFEAKPVHVNVSHVNGDHPGTLGAVIILHDNSVRTDLEEQLETLHQKTTLDPLTGVANRSHFDDTIAALTEATAAGGPSYSLLICDIDHFKQVNDVHGHPAGDEALVKFASVLVDHSRQGDLVARYGGEEFLMLAVNCDNATAAKRAEAIRIALETTPLPSLNGESVTASFGVTEYQSGDTAETVLARSDRALLKAKDNGRNRVVQLGSGQAITVRPEETKRTGWLGWFDSGKGNSDTEVDILTPVPINLAIEKLRGFIADHGAEIISVNESQVVLKMDALRASGGRRVVDQHIALKVELTLSERVRPPKPGCPSVTKTRVHVNLTPLRSRDRRNRQLKDCVDRVVASLRSYLMGEIMDPNED